MAIFTNCAIPNEIYAEELGTLCPDADCKIIDRTNFLSITNNTYLIYTSITLTNTNIRDFTNSGTIITSQGIKVESSSQIANIFRNTGSIDFAPNALQANIMSGDINTIENSGTIGGGIFLKMQHKPTIVNTGIMGGINHDGNDIMINNTGTINLYFETSGKLAHLVGSTNTRPIIQNYAVKINENQTTFNSFSGYNYNNQAADKTQLLNKTAHFVVKDVNWDKFTFDASAKIYIDFDSTFELGKTYLINKIITDANGNGMLPSDYFSRLALKNADIYTLTRHGEYFIIGGASGDINTPITELYKTNIKVMNNMFMNSNALIFRQKQRVNRANPASSNQRRVIHRISSLFDKSIDYAANRLAFADNAIDSVVDLTKDSIDSSDSANLYALNNIQSNEHFFYTQNRSLQTKRTTRTRSANQSQNFYFVFTPFLNHNYFYEAGNYRLSGLDGGFITAFSGKLGFGNTLGAHFGFGYGSLGDKNDKAFSIKSVNLMLGLNYRLDLIWDMFIKARGDFFYFANEVSSTQVAKIKPNNVGFGISASYGKDFNFKNYGVLGVELALDYKALNATSISVKSALDGTNMQNYSKSLYNLIYLDLGVNYDKYFITRAGQVGLNAGIGLRGNLAPKLAKSTLLVNGLKINAVLDNDKFLGYVNIGGSYVLNMRKYVMEFGIAFNGSYGDRSMSNGGNFEWRVIF